MANNRTRYEQALRKGRELNQQNRHKEALGAFRVALNEFNNQPAVYVGIGDACIGLKHLSRALECYKLAARLDRSNIAHLLSVADTQERMGQLSEAGQTYLAAGEYSLRAHNSEAAIGHWERAVRLDPNQIGAHKRLAMIFQKQGDRKAAVREYLAIARILDMGADKRKALQICRAALRLDPHNKDVMTAIELIQKGAAAYPEPELESELDFENEALSSIDKEVDPIFGAVRQMANLLEKERSKWQLDNNVGEEQSGPVESARHQAEEELAAELFREENEEDVAAGEMIKLERDALISQAMDFQARGSIDQAISAYKKAVDLGLKVPAAHFMLGLLYVRSGQKDAAFHALAVAANHPTYQKAARTLLNDLKSE